MVKEYIHKIPSFTIILLLVVFLGGCDTFRKIITNSYTLHGKYVDYNCNPISNKTIKVVNRIELNQFLSSGTGSVDTDITNDEGEFELKLYEGEYSRIIIDDKPHYTLNKVDLEQLENKSSNAERIYFYRRHVNDNYIDLGEFREWIMWNNNIKQTFTGGSPLSFKIGNGGRTVSVSSRSIDETDTWVILIQAKDGYLIKEKKENNNGVIPTSGYKPSAYITLTNEELNEWKQHQFYTKSVAGKIYGKFSLDIAVLSYDKAPNYGYHGMRVIYIWSHGQFIRSAKSIYSNTTPESSKYVELDKLLPIEEPYISSKSCGNRPNFYNNQFIRHPEPSKLHIKQWEERKASYK
jgi:hypothetical protein